MTTRQFATLTKGTTTSPATGRYDFKAGTGSAPVTTLTTATMISTMATLVAAGASPTQAEVTAANNAWTALLAQINAVAVETGDAYLSFDTSKVETLNDVRAMLDKLELWARSAGFK